MAQGEGGFAPVYLIGTRLTTIISVAIIIIADPHRHAYKATSMSQPQIDRMQARAGKMNLAGVHLPDKCEQR